MSSREQQNRRIMIVAGESSGDLHGSNLIKAAARLCPNLSFFGVGGPRMEMAGCRIIIPSDELSVMGVVEVLKQLPRIYRYFRQLKKILRSNSRPDLLVLIDFPDFNLRLAKVAKSLGIPVLYYITPKVWAWRRGRAKTIAENTDHLALIFPFEPEIFRPLGVAAEYVGNPLLDEFVENQPSGDLRDKLGFGKDEQVVGIFPGSRNSEVQNIFSSLVETMKLIHRRKPQVKFLLPIAPSLPREVFESRLAQTGLPIHLLDENIYEVATACDAVLTVSGTVTLQLALVATPMAILYKISPLSYAIGKRLVKISFAGLTNIVAGREIVREFIQDAAEPSAMCDEINRLLDDDSYSSDVREKLNEVKQLLGSSGCSERVVGIIGNLLAKA